MSSVIHQRVDADSKADNGTLFRKINWRVLPILWLCYVLNSLDKTNISFAQLRMKETLGFSDAVFGLAGGLLFAGLIVFEIPSNIILPRIGFRTTLFRIMVCWGLATAAICSVTGPIFLYSMRFLVGAFEAGFSPGVFYYLSLWYPEHRRGQAIAIFMTAASFARIVAGPLAAAIMVQMDGVAGFQGWQWLFIGQGLPCILVAGLAYLILVDKPESSQWRSAGELAVHRDEMAQDGPVLNDFKWKHFVELVTDIRLWAGSLIGFLLLTANFGLTFWQPVLLRGLGLSLTQVGLVSTLPSICGITAGILLARRSDAGGERCWHFVFGACVGALGFVLATISPTNPAAVIASLCVTWAGLSGAYGLTWVIPSKVLVGRHSATGYALISVIQGAAGFVGPVMIAYIKTATGSFDLGLYAMATTSLAAALVCICFYYVLPIRAPAPKLT